MKKLRTRLYLSLLLELLLFNNSFAKKSSASIYVSKTASKEEQLAAKEIRKYVYLRTNELLPIVTVEDGNLIKGNAILVGETGSGLMNTSGYNFQALGKDAFILKTVSGKSGKQLLVCGGSPVGTLYAAYHLAEQLGVGFFLDGDVIPDKQIPFALPNLDIVQSPLFERRGIQPFHDFPEGPDWWNLSDYKAIFAQLPKLKMNFFGMHTYPEGSAGPRYWPTNFVNSADVQRQDG